MAIKYKIKETAIDAKDSLIVKTGGEVEFSFRNIQDDISYLNKKRIELTAQMGLEEAKKINVLRTHPHIEQMSEEDRIACYLYQQSYAFCKVAVEKLAEIDKQLSDYEEEKLEIIKQTGINYEENQG